MAAFACMRRISHKHFRFPVLSLGIRKVWRSRRLPERHSAATSSGLTVVTAASLSRLEALEAQCRSWDGPLAAAVYLPLLVAPRIPSSLGGGGDEGAAAGAGAGGAAAAGWQPTTEHREALEGAERQLQLVFQR